MSPSLAWVTPFGPDSDIGAFSHNLLREFHRVLKPRGTLVFSTHHPFNDWQYFKTEDYFAVDLLEDEWEIGKIKFYRRPLAAISRDLEMAGFDIEQILEPQPTEDFKRINPQTYEKHMKQPLFLVVRAKKKN